MQKPSTPITTDLLSPPREIMPQQGISLLPGTSVLLNVRLPKVHEPSTTFQRMSLPREPERGLQIKLILTSHVGTQFVLRFIPFETEPNPGERTPLMISVHDLCTDPRLTTSQRMAQALSRTMAEQAHVGIRTESHGPGYVFILRFGERYSSTAHADLADMETFLTLRSEQPAKSGI